MQLKLLFVLGRVYPNDDANSNIFNRIAYNLISTYNDISIHELGIIDNSRVSLHSTVNGIKVTGMPDPFFSRLSKDLCEYLVSAHAGSRNDRMGLLLNRPLFALEYIFKKIVYGNLEKKYRSEIKEIIRREHIDVVISVSYPFHTCYATAKAKIKIPFIYYQLDPFFSHYQQKNRYLAMKKEEYVCKRTFHIFMTDLIHKEYESSALKKYLAKSTMIEFPSIRKIEISDDPIDLIDNQRTHTFMFIGSTYSDIRSPLYCLDLFSQLADSGRDFKLYFIGPRYGIFNEKINELIKSLDSKVCFLERVSSKQADILLSKADFLVNIGNSINNQMPSKIFDYFSVGKPIINFYKNSNCPTLKYTKRYPLCINILETEEVSDEIVTQITKFVDQYKIRSLSFEEVSSIYDSCTVQHITDNIKKILNEAVSRKTER